MSKKSFSADWDPSSDYPKVRRTLSNERLSDGNLYIMKYTLFFNFDSEIATALFGSFLLNDYRGGQKDLKSHMTDERTSPAFILKIRDYYFR